MGIERRARDRSVGALIVAVALSLCACSGREIVPGAPHPQQSILDAIAERESSRNEELDFYLKTLRHEDATVRRATVRAMGRLQLSTFSGVLVQRIADERAEPIILAEIAFALGQIADPSAFSALQGLAVHGNIAVRTAAVEAIGKLKELESKVPTGEDPLAPLLTALDDSDPTVRGTAALALWRREAKRAVPALTEHLDRGEDGRVRWRAAYALMRIDDPATLPPLREGLADPDPWVRTFAAWGMRNPVHPDNVAPLVAMLDDSDSFWTARAQAYRTLSALRAEAKKQADGEESKAPTIDDAPLRKALLARLTRESHPIAMRALIEAIGEGHSTEEQEALEGEIARPSSKTARRTALTALGMVGRERAVPLLVARFDDDDAWARAAVAAGLGSGGIPAIDPLAERLDAAREPDARVRSAAVGALAKIDLAESWAPIFKRAVHDLDLAVRGSAVYAIAEQKPTGWVKVLGETYLASSDAEFWDLRQKILNTLADERAEPQWSAVVAAARKDPVFAVRQVVAQLMEEPLAASPTVNEPLPYAMIRPEHLYDGVNPKLTVEFDKGEVVFELFHHEAPRHVSYIVHLARQGFYDGLSIHRVEPAFVVQGGDPRGDGWGDTGEFLPDEINAWPYLRGALGMPKATKDDGSCQLFVTHLPTPHLDGRYTVFGRVVLGMSVIDELEVGDRIVRASVDENDFRPLVAEGAAEEE